MSEKKSIKVRITVVLPVHNGEDFIGDAVASVLAQTFPEFRLLVVDDGSSDRTAALLSAINDPRVRILTLSNHAGLVEALNQGLRLADTEYIARMDADDVCLPRRFERQSAFLDSHPGIAICGTWSRAVGGGFQPTRRPPADPEDVRARMLFGGAVEHSSLMLRTDFLRQRQLEYCGDFTHAEDYDLMLRAADLAGIANLPEVLMRFRIHPGQVSVVHRTEQARSHARLVLRELRKLVPDATLDEQGLHLGIATGSISASAIPTVEKWLLKLKHANLVRARYGTENFGREIDRRWYYAHASGRYAGLGTLRSYWGSPLRDYATIGALRHARLASRCLVGAVSTRVLAG